MQKPESTPITVAGVVKRTTVRVKYMNINFNYSNVHAYYCT